MENNTKQDIINTFENIKNNFENLKKQSDEIQDVINVIVNCFKSDNKIMFCGNGGSASDSNHIASEFVGKYKLHRAPIKALSLTSNNSILTAISNDFSYKEVFSRQVEALGDKNDILFIISTSARSENIIEALKKAKEKGLITISLIGSYDKDIKPYSDYIIHTNSSVTNEIQEMHIAILHMICDFSEKQLF